MSLNILTYYIGLLILYSFSQTGAAAESAFQIPLEKENMKTLKPHVIEIHDPHENKNIHFKGYKTREFLDKNFPDWQDTENLEFVCSDGYKPLIPTEHFKKYESYLVYKRLDQEAFTISNPHQNEKNVKLGPYYLVWDNWDEKTKTNSKLDGVNLSSWPYQVVGLSSIDSRQLKKLLEPEVGGSATISKGFNTVKSQCLPCHTINGIGGKKAPELNYPTNITEYMGRPWLKKWIRTPRTIRFNTTMPEFKMMQDSTLDSVLDYLEYMKSKKGLQ